MEDEQINALYELRTWLAPSEQKLDPIQLGAEAEIAFRIGREVDAELAAGLDSASALATRVSAGPR